jgi:CRISPR-associated protein Cas2
MKEQPLYAVVYDVTDDKERRRVDRILTGFGFRVQKSVFECRLGRGDKAQLVGQLTAIGLKTGSVKLYRVYGGTQAVVVGQPSASPDDEPAYVY